MSDPLSDLFSLMEIANVRCTRLQAEGSWGVRFPATPLLKFVAVVSGECWVLLPEEEPHRMVAGDTFVLLDAPDYAVASDPDVPPVDGAPLFQGSDIARLNGDATVLLGGGFTIANDDARPLLDVLPAFLRIPAADPSAAVLHAMIAMIDAELEAGGIGSTILVRRLGDVLLLQALRAYAASDQTVDLGWIGALSDRHLGTALRLIHDDPGHGWTVATLAAASGLSRAGFALRFKEKLGVAPMAYVRRWRMRRARLALRTHGVNVAALASRSGYSSESAFRSAFRRTFGKPPKR